METAMEADSKSRFFRLTWSLIMGNQQVEFLGTVFARKFIFSLTD